MSYESVAMLSTNSALVLAAEPDCLPGSAGLRLPNRPKSQSGHISFHLAEGTSLRDTHEPLSGSSEARQMEMMLTSVPQRSLLSRNLRHIQ